MVRTLMISNDPVVRRVAGIAMLLAGVGVLIAFALVVGGRPVPQPAALLVGAVAGGLGAGGLYLLIHAEDVRG